MGHNVIAYWEDIVTFVVFCTKNIFKNDAALLMALVNNMRAVMLK